MCGSMVSRGLIRQRAEIEVWMGSELSQRLQSIEYLSVCRKIFCHVFGNEKENSRVGCLIGREVDVSKRHYSQIMNTICVLWAVASGLQCITHIHHSKEDEEFWEQYVRFLWLAEVKLADVVESFVFL